MLLKCILFHIFHRPPTPTQDRALSFTSPTWPVIHFSAFPCPVLRLPSFQSCLFLFATHFTGAIGTFLSFNLSPTARRYTKFILRPFLFSILLLNRFYHNLFRQDVDMLTLLYTSFPCTFHVSHIQHDLLIPYGKIQCLLSTYHTRFLLSGKGSGTHVRHTWSFPNIFPVHHSYPVISWTIPNPHVRHLFWRSSIIYIVLICGPSKLRVWLSAFDYLFSTRCFSSLSDGYCAKSVSFIVRKIYSARFPIGVRYLFSNFFHTVGFPLLENLTTLRCFCLFLTKQRLPISTWLRLVFWTNSFSPSCDTAQLFFSSIFSTAFM